jgi:hypothetical protein
MSRPVSAVWFGLIVAASPALAIGQAGNPGDKGPVAGDRSVATALGVTSDSSGSYDARALRIETQMGEYRIVRGLEGAVVGKIGLFTRPDVAALVAPSENAMREGREFNRNHGPGMLAGITGAAIFTFSLAASRAAGPNVGLTTGTVGGAMLMLYGATRLDKAYSALSKSIWWYNRDLKK